uniref:Uncharacterized protein n=1 Tax=Wuchereria bancrofti TaxID=6293 RepID=A0A1I8ESS9_WUCBA
MIHRTESLSIVSTHEPPNYDIIGGRSLEGEATVHIRADRFYVHFIAAFFHDHYVYYLKQPDFDNRAAAALLVHNVIVAFTDECQHSAIIYVCKMQKIKLTFWCNIDRCRIGTNL